MCPRTVVQQRMKAGRGAWVHACMCAPRMCLFRRMDVSLPYMPAAEARGLLPSPPQPPPQGFLPACRRITLSEGAP